jgi:hypothetical protein
MGVRPITERVAEVKEKRQRMKKRLEQYDEEIKRLEKQEAEEARKHRTHMLIVCGAELAALYGKVLSEDEIHAVVNFLREQQNAGIFTLRKTEGTAAEEPQEPIAETNGKDEDIFGELFGF